jgi:hypothetical protein
MEYAVRCLAIYLILIFVFQNTLSLHLVDFFLKGLFRFLFIYLFIFLFFFRGKGEVFLLSGFIKCTLPLIEFWIFCLAFGSKKKTNIWTC